VVLDEDLGEPIIHMLGGDIDPPRDFGGSSPLLKMLCNSESTENGHINYIYIPMYTVWPRQYTGVVRAQMHICIYAKKQFEKTNFANCRM